jgi:hypothetical protein
MVIPVPQISDDLKEPGILLFGLPCVNHNKPYFPPFLEIYCAERHAPLVLPELPR